MREMGASWKSQLYSEHPTLKVKRSYVNKVSSDKDKPRVPQRLHLTGKPSVTKTCFFTEPYERITKPVVMNNLK